VKEATWQLNILWRNLRRQRKRGAIMISLLELLPA
jgi:hypothetical protein